MFNFGKKKDDDDPQKAWDRAGKTVNSGLTGGLTKALMGQGFVDKMNYVMDQGQAAMNGVNQANGVAQNSLQASAEVLGVQDTGATVNMNPVVTLTLKVGTEFQMTGQAMVSRIAVPRVGDKIQIKYNPADLSQIAVL